MRKLKMEPDAAGYSVAISDGLLSVRLEGGASRVRRDIIGNTNAVNVQWTCDEDEYMYLRVFHRSVTMWNAETFLIDLCIESNALEEYKATFVPDSFQLTSQQGLMYVVSAQLEAEPSANISQAADELYLYLQDLTNGRFLVIEDRLDKIVNIVLPGDFA